MIELLSPAKVAAKIKPLNYYRWFWKASQAEYWKLITLCISINVLKCMGSYKACSPLS